MLGSQDCAQGIGVRPKALHALMLQLARLLLAWPLHVVVPAEQLSLQVAAFQPFSLQGRRETWLSLATALGLGGGLATPFGRTFGRSWPIDSLRDGARGPREHELLDGLVHREIMITRQWDTPIHSSLSAAVSCSKATGVKPCGGCCVRVLRR